MVQSIAVLSAYIAVRTGVGAIRSIVHSSAMVHSIGVAYFKILCFSSMQWLFKYKMKENISIFTLNEYKKWQ